MNSKPGNIVDAVDRFGARSLSEMEQSLPKVSKIIHHGGGGGGDDMDTNERIKALEHAQIQTGMDIAYIKGRVEDMPTKDWFNTRLLGVFAGLAGFIGIGLTVLGIVVSK